MNEDIEIWGEHLLEKLKGKKATENHKYFHLCLESFAKRTTNNQDATIAVSGDTGMGKTSMALAGSMILNKMGVKFNWDNICYSMLDMPDIVEKATSEEANSYIIDEAIDVAEASGFMTRFNREVRKIGNKWRKKRNIYWWCIPDFVDLDPGIRNRLIKWWFHIIWQSDHEERSDRYAIAAFFRKDMNPFQSDKWGIKDMRYMRRGITNHLALMKYLRKIRSFVTFIAFPILPAVIEEKYEQRSKEVLQNAGKEFKNMFIKTQK